MAINTYNIDPKYLMMIISITNRWVHDFAFLS